MLVGPNEGETAVYGCHCPRDMAMRSTVRGTGPAVGCCMYAPSFKFALFSMLSNQVQSIFHQLLYFMTFLNKFNSARV